MLKREELTQLEFNAYKLINSYIHGNNLLFNISKLENGYDLKNRTYHYRVIKRETSYYLVVMAEDREYFFDGENLNAPFTHRRNYNGEWQIFFENILENTTS